MKVSIIVLTVVILAGIIFVSSSLSDSPFLKIISPNLGGTFVTGQKFRVIWYSTGFGTESFYLITASENPTGGGNIKQFIHTSKGLHTFEWDTQTICDEKFTECTPTLMPGKYWIYVQGIYEGDMAYSDRTYSSITIEKR